MQFSELLNATALDADGLSSNVGDDWLQGRSVFGGLQAALAVRAMRALVAAGLPLRTLQTTFIAPVAGGAVRVVARVLRTGGSTTVVEARLIDAEQTLALLVGVFGWARKSAVALSLVQPKIVNPAPLAMKFVAGVTPNFLQHFDARVLRGGLPFSGNEANEASIEIALRDSGPTTESHAIAIADYPPPVALAQLKTFAPGSSLTWMLEFLIDSFDHLPLDGWRIDVEMIAARDGYTNQSGTLWGPDGVAIALSRQSMVVYG